MKMPHAFPYTSKHETPEEFERTIEGIADLLCIHDLEITREGRAYTISGEFIDRSITASGESPTMTLWCLVRAVTDAMDSDTEERVAAHRAKNSA
jgi:hypothetical protein